MSRGAIATSLQPLVFVSIHHNAEPDEVRATPRAPRPTSRSQSPESKRAAGLVYEELVEAFGAYDIAVGRPTATPARSTGPRTDGTDYYGILRRSAGVPAVLSEAAFISNPAEEALLADPAFQQRRGHGAHRGHRPLRHHRRPGSGYVTPYPRTQPAGPGGGSDGCEDPPLG